MLKNKKTYKISLTNDFLKLVLSIKISDNVPGYAMFAATQWRQIWVERSGTAYTLLSVPQAEPECNVPKGGRRVSF